MLSLLFFVLAAIANAVMDTSVHHYSTSKFKTLDPLFWNGEISWKNKYINGDPKLGRVRWYFGLVKPVQLTDAFHLFKSLMIIFISLSITTFDIGFFSIDEYSLISFPLVVLLYGFLWNTTFSLFYDKILK